MMKVLHLQNGVYLIEGFLTESECDDLIEKSEKAGYEEATINTEKGARMMKEVRNNFRYQLSDQRLAVDIWKRLEQYTPKTLGNSNSIGLNELFRFYKYTSGQKFSKHIDESFIRNEIESSYYTVLFYLNDNFEGGDTRFEELNIECRKGAVLIFLHSIPHEGTEVISGVKYVLRSDIMYRLDVDQKDNIS